MWRGASIGKTDEIFGSDEFCRGLMHQCEVNGIGEMPNKSPLKGGEEGGGADMVGVGFVFAITRGVEIGRDIFDGSHADGFGKQRIHRMQESWKGVP